MKIQSQRRRTSPSAHRVIAAVLLLAALSEVHALAMPELPPPVFADTSSKVVARGTDEQNEQITVALSNDAVMLLLR